EAEAGRVRRGKAPTRRDPRGGSEIAAARTGGSRPCGRSRAPVRACRRDPQLLDPRSQGEGPPRPNQAQGHSRKGANMPNVTREVISDLWPLYLSNDLSAGSRRLSEEFLESDPTFTQSLPDVGTDPLESYQPPSLPPDHEMKTLERI